MRSIPEARVELSEWRLYLAVLASAPGADPAGVEMVLVGAVDATRRRHGQSAISDDPVVRAVRHAFRRSGSDPTRYRPAYEALARRVIKSGDLPRILPWVDLNNALSLICRLPCCVGEPRALRPPLVLRRGTESEAFESLRGPFPAAAKPLLCDADGPVGTPVVDAERVRVRAGSDEVLFWSFVPAGIDLDPAPVVRETLGRCGFATVVDDGWATS